MTDTNYNFRNQRLRLFVYAIIFLSTSINAFIGIFYGAGSGQVGDGIVGLGYFKPFTMDSNILAAFASLILIICEIRNRISGNDSTPRWAVVLLLMGTSCLSLTFLVAALFLAPMEVLRGGSYFTMFCDDMFFFHLLNPLLSVVAFTRLQQTYHFQRKECILGAIPTILYSFVYLTMVVILKRWNDFYGFTFGGRYELIPAVIIMIYAIVFGVSLLLIRSHNRCMKVSAVFNGE